MDLEKSLEFFIDSLSTERCISNNTVIAYRSDLMQFVRWIKTREMNNNSLIDYIEELKFNHKSSSISRKITVIKAWARFCRDELGSDMPFTIPRYKSSRNIPQVMSNSDLAKLRAAASLDESANGARVSAVVEMLYSSGMRVSELLSVKIEDLRQIIDGRSQSLTIIGKGNKERIIFLTPTAISAMRKYINLCNHRSGPIFGNATRQCLYKWLKKLARIAGVNEARIFPHSFRHRLGSNLAQRGMSLPEIQQLFGHSKIDTTSIYMHLDDELLYQMVCSKHPLCAQL